MNQTLPASSSFWIERAIEEPLNIVAAHNLLNLLKVEKFLIVGELPLSAQEIRSVVTTDADGHTTSVDKVAQTYEKCIR